MLGICDMSAIRILRLNNSGLPQAWASREEAATLYCKGLVVWGLGDDILRLHGGINATGQRSVLDVQPIIACRGDTSHYNFTPSLSNAFLFRRDAYQCMYCGKSKMAEGAARHSFMLTRDHVIPKVQGGQDTWTNVVTACSRCNHHKGGRNPEQAGMQLLAVPFKPNVFEFMYLANRRIRGDQMQYLQVRFSGRREWQAA